MKKRFAAVFAATAVLGVTTAFAANPFSDVTPSDWAYQSVSQLAAAGVINGYPDGTFQGQKNITRYEMAQMVAKAMANEARANAEQQAMINRLADEFSSELNNLGVRVANLENKVGNVKVTGDVRLKYQGTDKEGAFTNKDGGDKDKKSKFQFRGRVQFNATVNENTTATVRLTSGDREFGDADTGSTAKVDRVYVTHNFGKDFSLTAGRFNAFIGNGLIYDDTFDGAALTYAGDKVTATVAHGYFMEAGLFGSPLKDGKVQAFGNTDYEFGDQDEENNLTFTVLQANAKLGNHAVLGGFYAFGNKNVKNTFNKLGYGNDDQDIYGGSLDLNFDKVWVGGEYATFSNDFKGKDNGSDNDAWVAGIGYGDYDIAKEGTWGVKVQYFDEGKYSPVISSTWNQPYNSDYKAWMATVDYALAKNVGLSAYATFGAENQKGDDAPEYYRAELNYKF
ncbi:S-layer homology domain-containing protein [uncultured Veillonella sp.]|uniref:S-layer homology domain-containing protein n=1 Tax=uncultured Veillonella sp. TaxID=159268 RepID=UPI0025988BB3|nr:S-layer homology domain-containing protein [uncultured Veillonella sp.]